jgi:hypothetical protein
LVSREDVSPPIAVPYPGRTPKGVLPFKTDVTYRDTRHYRTHPIDTPLGSLSIPFG